MIYLYQKNNFKWKKKRKQMSKTNKLRKQKRRVKE